MICRNCWSRSGARLERRVVIAEECREASLAAAERAGAKRNGTQDGADRTEGPVQSSMDKADIGDALRAGDEDGFDPGPGALFINNVQYMSYKILLGERGVL